MTDLRDCRHKYDGQETMIHAPDSDLYISFEEGTGDNLLAEDMKEGYVDYINWYSYKADPFALNQEDRTELVEEDGGMVLLKVYAKEMAFGEVVTAVLKEADANSGEVILIS